jgi:hypothetical protein
MQVIGTADDLQGETQPGPGPGDQFPGVAAVGPGQCDGRGCRLVPLIFFPLCRARHNANHAGWVVMPGWPVAVGGAAGQRG